MNHDTARLYRLVDMSFLLDRVIDGMDTLDDLEKVPVNDKNYRPVQDIYLRRITIHANPIAD